MEFGGISFYFPLLLELVDSCYFVLGSLDDVSFVSVGRRDDLRYVVCVYDVCSFIIYWWW